jgi:putative DNA methylase
MDLAAIERKLWVSKKAAEQQGLLGDAGAPKVGETTFDRVHQAMILFGTGRSEALTSFVVEEGVGKDARSWKLAGSFSKRYPSSAAEKRGADGVLARKKGLGFWMSQEIVCGSS